jgi:hypothetical protein
VTAHPFLLRPQSEVVSPKVIWRAVVFLAFALLIFWQGSTALRLAAGDRPYGGPMAWDEVYTYNNARVPSGPHGYGSLCNFLQILATQYFLLYDPDGPGADHYAVSNNNIASFTSRHAEFDGSLSPTFPYSYFRGLDDYKPIFLSRRIHLGVAYGLALLIGALALYYVGLEAVLLLVPLGCLTVNTDMVLHAGMALPNAINAVIAFGVTLLSFLAVAERRESCQYVGAALMAIAVNMKLDAVLLGSALGLAILVSGWRAGLAVLCRQILLSAGIFVLVYTATNPQVLTDIGPLLAQISSTRLNVGHTPLGSIATALQNLGVLPLFLEDNLVPWRRGDILAGIMLSIGLVALALGGLAIVYRGRRADLVALAVPAASLLVLWLYPMMTITIFGTRYYLNGLGALYALIGAVLLTMWRLRTPPGRPYVMVILALMVVQYGTLTGAHRAVAARVETETFYVGSGDRRDGFARGFTRNEVERRAIEAWHKGGYDPTIVVDQHGYFDLRMLRLAGMRPVYINLFNYEEVLGKLDRSVDHLLLLSPGSYATDPSWWSPWQALWTPETTRRYDAYRARLDTFPMREEIAGPPQRLLWAGPVQPDDRMLLVVIPHN